MKLYRAIPRRNFDPNFVGRPRTTRRIPSNVPFVVDNLWEFLRPDHLPSRRHAIYASPTPELALAGASADGPLKEGYLVCELEFFQERDNSTRSEPLYRVVQLAVPDAREHPDVFLLKKLALAKLGAEFADLPLSEKLGASALFLPGTTPEDLKEAAQANPAVRAILSAATELSTFWTDVREPSEGKSGEMFFELLPGAAYRLKPLS